MMKSLVHPCDSTAQYPGQEDDKVEARLGQIMGVDGRRGGGLRPQISCTWTHRERREHIKLQGINPSRNQWVEQGAGWRVKQLSIKRATATPGEWESSARPGRNCLSPGSCSNVCLNLPGLMGAVQRSDSDQTVSRVGSWCWSWGWMHFNLIRKTIQTLGWHLRWL